MKPKLLIVTYVNLPKNTIKYKKENKEIDKILKHAYTFCNVTEKEIMSKTEKEK